VERKGRMLIVKTGAILPTMAARLCVKRRCLPTLLPSLNLTNQSSPD
jgi:hypothetical protein